MPWLTPGQGGAFGFVPYSGAYGELVTINPYVVTSSESQIFAGDPVTASTFAGANIMLPVARLTSSASGTMPLLGIAAHGLAAGAGSTSASLTTLTSALLLVYDSPDQLFYVNDSSSFIISSTQVGRNVQFSATAGGSTAANRSGYFIAGNTASSNPSFQFRIQSVHPTAWIVGGVSTAGGGTGASTDVRPWVVKPVNHYYGQGSTSIIA